MFLIFTHVYTNKTKHIIEIKWTNYPKKKRSPKQVLGGHRKEFFNPLHFRVLETDVSNEKSDIRTILAFILSMIKREIPPYLGFTTYYHLINPYMQGLTDENITLGIIT